MKYLFVLLLFIPFIAQTQNRIEGYNIFKLGQVLDKSKVTPDEKQYDGTEKWKVSDSALLHNGRLIFDKILITTYNDTVETIRLVIQSDGFFLYNYYKEKYGNPIQKTIDKYKNVETATWKTGGTQIFFFTPEGTFTSTAVYSNIHFLEMRKKKNLEPL